MREFDLGEAIAGKPVCTRDGRKVRILCFDRVYTNREIIGLVPSYHFTGTREDLYSWSIGGKISLFEKDDFDLMIVD